MEQDTTAELQTLLDRLRAGDKAARRVFLEQVCGRWRRLAAKILFGSFPTANIMSQAIYLRKLTRDRVRPQDRRMPVSSASTVNSET